MPDRVLARMFRGLVEQVGGVDPAVATIEASTGESVSRGTISKIQNCEAHVPLAWAFILEDATGNFAFTRDRMRRLEAADRKGAARSVAVCHLDTMREATEAVLAQAQAETSDDWEALARARKETDDLLRIAEDARDTLTRREAELRGRT